MSRHKPVPTSRYSFREATKEVQRVLGRLGRGAPKATALGIGITEQQMSSKLRGVTDEMTIDQLGKIANLFSAPAGWPWVTWPEPELLKALPTLLERLGL